MKKLLCKIFGHYCIGYGGSTPYGKVSGGHEDGIGRTHHEIHLKCDRCGHEYSIVKFHSKKGTV